MKGELKDHVVKLLAEPRFLNRTVTGGKWVAHLDFDAFFVNVVLSKMVDGGRAYQGKPVVIGHTFTDGEQQASAAKQAESPACVSSLNHWVRTPGYVVVVVCWW